jgi:hypothetical protein
MEKKVFLHEPKTLKRMFVPTGKPVIEVFTSMTLPRLFTLNEIVYPTPPTSYLQVYQKPQISSFMYRLEVAVAKRIT